MADRSNYWLRRNLSRRRLIGGAGAAGVGIAALGFVGCGGDDDDGGDNGGAGLLPTKAPDTPTAKQPKPGGSFSFQISGPPPSLDTYATTSFLASYVHGLSYSKLLRFAAGVPQVVPGDFKKETDLAAKMPEQPDKTTYVFTLKDAKFHPVAPTNGRAVTSEDVKYSLERYRDYEKSVHKSTIAWLDRVETPDAKTVRIVSKFPYADVIDKLGDSLGAWIEPREHAESDAANQKMVGSGPFINTEVQSGASFTFKKNPDYYDKPYPYFDEVKTLITTDQAKRVADFAAKSVDLTWLFLPDERDQLKKSRADAKYEETQGIGGYIYLRADKPPFNDKRVRQALSMAINRKAIREALSKGEGVPDQTVFVGFPFATQVKDLGAAAKYWDYNPKEARALLDAALGAGQKLEATWSHAAEAAIYTQAYLDTATLAQSHFKDVGVEIKDNPQPYSQYIATTYQGQYEGMGHSPRAVPTFIDYLSERLSFADGKRGRINLSYVNNPTLEDLLSKQRQEFNSEARLKIVKQIEALVAEEQYEIYFSTDTRTYFWDPKIENYRPSSFFPYTHVMKTWRDA